LEFALKELHNKNSFAAGNRRAVVLFTDGKPRLPKAEFFGEEKRRYFMGGPIASGTANYPLAPIAHELQDSAVKLYMIAIGDERQDADLWQKLIPSYHYQPIDPTTNLSEVYRKLFGDLFDVGITLQNGESERTLSQKLQHTERWLWLVALLLAVAIIALVAQLRKIEAQKQEQANFLKQYEKEKREWESKLTQLQLAYDQLQEEYAKFQEQYKQEKTNWESEREQWQKYYSQANDGYFKPLEDEVNVLLKKADEYREKKDFEQADKIYIEALNLILEFIASAENFASLKIRLILLARLEINKGLQQQRKIIYEQAHAQAPHAQIRGLALVLFDRWTSDLTLMKEEFYGILYQPQGVEVMKVLSSLEPPKEWEKYRQERYRNLQRLTNTYCRFNEGEKIAA
jgi:hypothetical protein